MRKIVSSVVVGLALAAAATAQSITVLSPNGGETWLQGENHHITWSVSATEATGEVDIFLIQGETTLGYITGRWPITANYGAPPVSSLHGFYPWPVGEHLPPAPTSPGIQFAQPGINYKVMIRKRGSTVQDASDAFFRIVSLPAPPATVILKLNSPNGGEVWKVGTSQSISWSSTNLTGSVKLELVREPDDLVGVIATNLPANGTSPWNAGALQKGTALPGSYRVRVRSQATPARYDDSDQPFKLLKLLAGQP